MRVSSARNGVLVKTFLLLPVKITPKLGKNLLEAADMFSPQSRASLVNVEIESPELSRYKPSLEDALGIVDEPRRQPATH